MENSTFPSEKRVFQIDNECYIVYLGSDREDYKPFLRVGNSKSLTQEIISNIYNIIITDSYIGNPSLEAFNINTVNIHENRYVGNENTIRKFLVFLNNFNIETSKITQYQKIKTEDNKALVFFYDDGNVNLNYDKKLLFDLKSREKKDLHFIEKTKWIMAQFLKNSLRYSPSDFNKPGFAMVKNSVVLFNREKIIAFSLPDDYFYTFTQSGIDPDLISAVITEDATESIIDLLKRKKYKKEKIDVLSRNMPLLKSALDLFESSKEDSLKSTLSDLTKKSAVTKFDYTIRANKDALRFKNKEIPYSISISDKLEKAAEKELLINHTKKAFTLPGRSVRESVKIPEGIPHIFIMEEPPIRGLLETFFKELLTPFVDLLSSVELVLIKQLESLFNDIINDTKFHGSLKNVKRGINRIKINSKSSVIFLLSNAGEICSLLINMKKNKQDAVRSLSNIKASINKRLRSIETVDISLPLICNLYISEQGTYSLYRLFKNTVTKDEYSLSQDIISTIEEKVRGKNEYFQQERRRLIDLIDELMLPPSAVEAKVKPGARKEEMPVTAREKRKTLIKRIFIPVGIVLVLGIAFSLFFLIPRKGKIETKEEEVVIEQTLKVETPEKTLEPHFSLSDIEITVLDIYRVTNEIAKANGYRELDKVEELGKDPDWIYPENVFFLPDKTSCTVKTGDTIWYIANRYIKETLDHDWEKYLSILKELDKNKINMNNRKRLISELELLRESSYSENFAKEIDKGLKDLAMK